MIDIDNLRFALFHTNLRRNTNLIMDLSRSRIKEIKIFGYKCKVENMMAISASHDVNELPYAYKDIQKIQEKCTELSKKPEYEGTPEKNLLIALANGCKQANCMLEDNKGNYAV